MTVSKQQKCGLGFAAVCCILFGGAIATCGLLFQHHDNYKEDFVNGMGNTGYYQYYYTQYWLGVPLIFLGLVMVSFLCSKARPLLYLCIVLSSLTLTLAIAAVVLEGPKWTMWLSRSQAARDNDEKEFNGTCVDHSTSFHFTAADGSKGTMFYLYNDHLGLSCKEVFHAALMQSVLTICSILAIVLCQFIIFLSLRVLDLISQGSYYSFKNRNTYNGHSSNTHMMADM